MPHRFTPEEAARARKMAKDCGLKLTFVLENMYRERHGIPVRVATQNDREPPLASERDQ